MSKTVHIRLDDTTIAYCFMAIKKAGRSTIGVPIATAVAQTLKAFINGAVTAKQLKSITPFEAEEFLLEMLEDGRADSLIPDQIAAPIFDMEEESDIDLSSLKQNISSAINVVLDGGVVASAPTALPSVEEQAAPLLEFAAIQGVSPLDALVQQALEIEDETDRQRVADAICIVYTHLSEDMWGTPKAAILVRGTVDTLQQKGGE